MLYKLFKLLPPWVQWLGYHLKNSHFLIGVVGILAKDHKVLLVRNSYRSGWSLPGGMLEAGEEITDCFTREIFEELHLRVINPRIFTTQKVTARLVEICLIAETEVKELVVDNKELLEARFFAQDELPQNISPNSRQHVNNYFSLK